MILSNKKSSSKSLTRGAYFQLSTQHKILILRYVPQKPPNTSKFTSNYPKKVRQTAADNTVSGVKVNGWLEWVVRNGTPSFTTLRLGVQYVTNFTVN